MVAVAITRLGKYEASISLFVRHVKELFVFYLSGDRPVGLARAAQLTVASYGAIPATAGNPGKDYTRWARGAADGYQDRDSDR